MSVNRREAVKLLVAAGATITGALPGRAGPDDVTALYVVIDGLSPEIGVERIQAILAPILAREIRFGLIMRPNLFGGDSAPRYRDLFHHLVDMRADAVELIPWSAEIGAAQPYFQGRAAYELRQSMARFMGAPIAGADRVFAPLTVATDANAPMGFDGVRAAGFRQVLMVGADTPSCGASVRCLSVTQTINMIDPNPNIQPRVGQDRVVRISLQGIQHFTRQTVMDRARSIADQVWGRLQRHLAFNPLPRNRLQYLGPAQGRFVAVRLHGPRNDLQQLAYDALRDALNAARIAFSEDAAGPPLADATFDTETAIAQGIGSVLDMRDAALGGRDAQAILHLPVQQLDAGLGALDAPGRDMVISLFPQFFMRASQRENMVSILRRLQDADLTTVVSVPDYLQKVAPHDPFLTLLHQTRADMPEPDRTPRDDHARALLAQDARQAWEFVVRMTNPATGLCASTAFFDPDYPSTYHGLTMWDLGSLYFAILNAHRLGLIDDAEYLARLQPVLAGTRAVQVAGLTLMPQEIATNRRGGHTPGFNPCDNGRLLSALKWIDRYPLSAGLAQELVSGWTLAAALQDGALRAIENTRLRPEVPSHCSQYTARALRAWAIDAVLPFQNATDTADAAMRLLHDAAAIGPITAEPLLYETLEMGDTPVSAYLTRLLFGAQLRASQASGQLFAVSEAPLDRAPWFTYQGFQIGDEADPWRVVSPDRAAEFRTPRFRDSVRLINTKAAFLWAAVWPGAYSDRLLAVIRAKAPIEGGGFSPGVLAQTGESMPNYTDINTNAAILQSVAHMLLGRLQV